MTDEADSHSHYIVPELRSVDAWDRTDPVDPQNFELAVQAIIGPMGEKGEEIFYLTVCTPQWLANYVSREKYIFGIHRLIVERYNWDLIEDVVRRLCRRISGKSWQEVTTKLNRFAGWEYEDYEECPLLP